jgi:hypothetical protein
MAFALENFSPIGGQSRRGKAPQHFSYATLDAVTDVDTANYFRGTTAYGGAYHHLEVGDVIHRVTWSTAIGEGGTISSYGTHIVLSKANGDIDVSNETDLTETDSR